MNKSVYITPRTHSVTDTVLYPNDTRRYLKNNFKSKKVRKEIHQKQVTSCVIAGKCFRSLSVLDIIMFS